MQCILGVSDTAEDLGLLPTRGPEGPVPLRPGRPQVERDDLAPEDGHAGRTETPEGVHTSHVRCQHTHTGQRSPNQCNSPVHLAIFSIG